MKPEEPDFRHRIGYICFLAYLVRLYILGSGSVADTLHSNEMIDIEKRFLLLSQFASFSEKLPTK